MEQNKSKTTAQDFFIYLGILIGLYSVAGSLINLLFGLINNWLPDINFYSNNDSSIRFSIAVLVIFFPIFMYLSRMSTKAVVASPEKKEMWVRRWFSYLTLFVGGATVATDLSVLVYRFIGGEDLSLRFLLKVLVVLVMAVVVFFHYLKELRRDYTIPTSHRKYFAYIIWLAIIVFVILGIVSIGTPTTQRSIRLDMQRVSDLSNIQNAVTDYYRANGNVLPQSLSLLSQSSPYYLSSIKDPESNTEYEYRILTKNQYQLCANFSLDNFTQKNSKYNYPVSENFVHSAGRVCFDRTVGEIPNKMLLD